MITITYSSSTLNHLHIYEDDRLVYDRADEVVMRYLVLMGTEGKRKFPAIKILQRELGVDLALANQIFKCLEDRFSDNTFDNYGGVVR